MAEEHLQTITVDLTSLAVDPSLQPRIGGLDVNHVRALMECPDQWPPVAVVDQSGRYLLLDGFHRLAAAQNLGWATVPVEVLEPPTDGDLQALAFRLNAAHGRPLSLADRRAFAGRLLRQHPDWADRAIGRQTGLSSNTVGRVRDALAASAQVEQPGTRLGAGGYTYRVGTNAKQRPPGELPDTGFGEQVGQLFTPSERRAQRQIADYLRRLAVALEDGADVEAWANATRAAEACRAVLGRERCERLAGVLGRHGVHLYHVARGLGWNPEAAS